MDLYLMKSKTVFLSYSRRDSEIMKSITSIFIENGINVWTDEGITPGTADWQVAIEDAIENSTSLVCLFSPDAKKSKWVKAELRRAELLNIPVFPIVVRGTDIEAVPFGYEHVQSVDLRNITIEELSASLKLLINELRLLHSVSSANHANIEKNERTKQSSNVSLSMNSNKVAEKSVYEFTPNAVFNHKSIDTVLSTRILEFIPEPFGLVYIPSGSRDVPTYNTNDTRPKPYEINTSAFVIAKYPITVGQFANFLIANPFEYNKRFKHFKNYSNGFEPSFIDEIISKRYSHDLHPVTGISWLDAVAFINWLSEVTGIGISLPYEKQWLVACGLLPKKDWELNLSRLSLIRLDVNSDNLDKRGRLKTKPVTQGFVNPNGVIDAYGNAWEWCENNSSLYSAISGESRFSRNRYLLPRNGNDDNVAGLWGGLMIQNINNPPRLLNNRFMNSNELMDGSIKTSARVRERSSTFGFRLCVDINNETIRHSL
ncbi:MAG: hypothetical protein Phog2KO_01040 [Phototrophicaceae bacterium]